MEFPCPTLRVGDLWIDYNARPRPTFLSLRLLQPIHLSCFMINVSLMPNYLIISYLQFKVSNVKYCTEQRPPSLRTSFLMKEHTTDKSDIFCLALCHPSLSRKGKKRWVTFGPNGVRRKKISTKMARDPKSIYIQAAKINIKVVWKAQAPMDWSKIWWGVIQRS